MTGPAGGAQPGPTWDSSDEARVALVISQYESLVNVLVAVFNEFWQCNAFFTAYATVTLAAFTSVWTSNTHVPWVINVCAAAVYAYLMILWYISTWRHIKITEVGMKQAREIELTTTHLSMYHRRAAMPSRISVRRIWLSTPVVFLAAGMLLFIASIVK